MLCTPQKKRGAPVSTVPPHPAAWPAAAAPSPVASTPLWGGRPHHEWEPGSPHPRWAPSAPAPPRQLSVEDHERQAESEEDITVVLSSTPRRVLLRFCSQAFCLSSLPCWLLRVMQSEADVLQIEAFAARHELNAAVLNE